MVTTKAGIIKLAASHRGVGPVPRVNAALAVKASAAVLIEGDGPRPTRLLLLAGHGLHVLAKACRVCAL